MEFKVGKEIGCGNFSRVYRATHRLDGCEYAIKRTKRPVTEVAEKNQWLQEVQALAAVSSHPNIVRYYGAWAEPDVVQGEHLYIQLELCGDSLGAQLASAKAPFREPELLALIAQMAAALKHMHDRGLVHLDLKPDNIYRCGEGCFKLGDFGLATLRHGKWRVLEGDARCAPARVQQ